MGLQYLIPPSPFEVKLPFIVCSSAVSAISDSSVKSNRYAAIHTMHQVRYLEGHSGATVNKTDTDLVYAHRSDGLVQRQTVKRATRSVASAVPGRTGCLATHRWATG